MFGTADREYYELFDTYIANKDTNAMVDILWVLMAKGDHDAVEMIAVLLMKENVPVDDILAKMPELANYGGSNKAYSSNGASNVFPTSYFVLNKRPDLLERFFEAGANPNVYHLGRSLLVWAISLSPDNALDEAELTQTIIALLKHGTDISLPAHLKPLSKSDIDAAEQDPILKYIVDRADEFPFRISSLFKLDISSAVLCSTIQKFKPSSYTDQCIKELIKRDLADPEGMEQAIIKDAKGKVLEPAIDGVGKYQFKYLCFHAVMFTMAGKPELLEKAMKSGVNFTRKNDYGQSIWHVVCSFKMDGNEIIEQAIVRLLEKAPHLLKEADDNGKTPADYARLAYADKSELPVFIQNIIETEAKGALKEGDCGGEAAEGGAVSPAELLDQTSLDSTSSELEPTGEDATVN